MQIGRLQRIVGVLSCLLIAFAANPHAELAGQSVLQASGGTFNFSAASPPGIAVAYAWQVSSEPVGPHIFVLKGPTDWNRGRPHRWSVARTGTGLKADVASFPELPAVAGGYTLTVIMEGREHDATFSVTLTPLLPRTEVRVVSATGEGVALSWTSAAGALSYQVVLVDLASRRRVASRSTRSTSHTFAGTTEGVAFPPGRYRVYVWAWSVDITQPPTAGLPPQTNGSEGAVDINIP